MYPISPMASTASNESLREQFSQHWQTSTADGNLTLHGFRRFKTTHLLNLRYLEAEIAQLDHVVYQLGLGLNIEPSKADRLGLRHAEKDKDPPSIDKEISRDLILRLRQLLKEYDDAIASFSTIMSMDTFSLLDDEEQCFLRKDLTLYEMYKTRLLRVDQAPRRRQDPLQRSVHRLLRMIRYLRISRSSRGNVESASSMGPVRRRDQLSSQNTALIADIISRSVIAIITAIFLIVPLAALAQEPRKSVQIAIVSIFVVAFASIVSVTLRASNLEMMVVSSAYAAIIAVFVSNSNPGVNR